MDCVLEEVKALRLVLCYMCCSFCVVLTLWLFFKNSYLLEVDTDII